MLVGVISDTHGNQEFMLRAVQRLKEMGAEVLLHLGDDETDAENGISLPLYSVPGKYEPAYSDPSNRARTLELDGWQVSMAHMIEDLPEAGIRLYGHTHRPAAEVSGGSLLVCPGHLKGPQDRSVPASFALLSLEKSAASVRILALQDGELIIEATLKKGRR